MKLGNDQKYAMEQLAEFLTNDDEQFFVVQGSAGTGKSTMVRSMVEQVLAYNKIKSLLKTKDKIPDDANIMLTATTNPAAAVLTQLTDIEAGTIHSALGLKVINDFKTGKTKLVQPGYRKDNIDLRKKIVIIDEAGMIDNDLWRYLQDTMHETTKIIMVCDWFQLPPVNQQYIIAQKLACRKAVMSEVFRHDGNILALGNQFRDAIQQGTDLPVIPHLPDIQQVSSSEFKELYGQDFKDKHSARILAYRNKRVIQYNTHVRAVLGLSETFEVGERVVTNKPIIVDGIASDTEVEITDIRENHEFYGLMGRRVTVTHWNRSAVGFIPYDEIKLTMKLNELKRNKEWHKFYHIKDVCLDLRNKFASTVHKAQGKTYDTVYIDLFDIMQCRFPFDLYRLLYVAITRARNKLVVYNGC